jgi:fimbrial chaperone protein
MKIDRTFGVPRSWILLGAGIMMNAAALSQVLVSPVVIEFGAKQRAATVKISLSDTAKAPMRLQAELMHWEQNLQGEDVMSPGNELLVTPPIADLQPGGTQLFRVAFRGTRAAPEEIAYRLILEDIAEPGTAVSDNTPQGSVAINFRMRYDLPVMVAPTGKIMNVLRWKPCPADTARASGPTSAVSPGAGSNEACMRLLNSGNRRVKVQTLTLVGDGWQQALPLKEGINVLAGAEREWRIPLQPGQTGAVRGVQVQTPRGETLQAEAGGF